MWMNCVITNQGWIYRQNWTSTSQIKVYVCVCVAFVTRLSMPSYVHVCLRVRVECFIVANTLQLLALGGSCASVSSVPHMLSLGLWLADGDI